MSSQTLPPELEQVFEQIRHLPINVEQVGTWLWVDSTRASRDALVAAGFRWSTRKKRWYRVGYMPPGHADHKLSDEETKEKHGSRWLLQALPDSD